MLNYPQVVASIGSRESRIKRAMDKVGLPFNVTLEVGDVETLKHYVAQGHGLAIVNSASLTPDDEALFHRIEIPDEYDPKTTYGTIIRQDKYVSSALGTMLALLGVDGN